MRTIQGNSLRRIAGQTRGRKVHPLAFTALRKGSLNERIRVARGVHAGAQLRRCKSPDHQVCMSHPPL
ncbi:hypothetical protein XACW160_130038 [Xanthomonas citri pv. citri]|nr:hypothetical protein XACW160_130038 [Xanthomonas citri pv. citri]